MAIKLLYLREKCLEFPGGSPNPTRRPSSLQVHKYIIHVSQYTLKNIKRTDMVLRKTGGLGRSTNKITKLTDQIRLTKLVIGSLHL